MKCVVEAIQRFCTPAFFHFEGQGVFDLSKVGSAFQFRYRGRNLVLCTRHQLGKEAPVDPAQFTVTLVEASETKVGLSPDFASRVVMEDSSHSSLEDLLLLEYENERNGRNLRGLFLNLDMGQTLETVRPESIQTIFAIGYPTLVGDVNPIEDEDGIPIALDMTLRWVKLYLAIAKPELLDVENRTPMIMDPRADQQVIDPDGLSGAPVFFIYLDAYRAPHLGFAGMITDARDERFMIYHGSHIRQIVDKYIDHATTR